MGPSLGTAGLGDVAKSVDIPVLALAGVSLAEAGACKAVGARGIGGYGRRHAGGRSENFPVGSS